MIIRALCSALILVLLIATTAVASPFDDWTAEEIFSHKDFTPSDYSLSSATNSGDPDAPHVYEWVGYIPVDGTRVYFTSYGEALTCVKWEQTGEWVPEWVVDALDKLVEEGLIKFP